jgi:hypothetical protein
MTRDRGTRRSYLREPLRMRGAHTHGADGRYNFPAPGVDDLAFPAGGDDDEAPLLLQPLPRLHWNHWSA